MEQQDRPHTSPSFMNVFVLLLFATVIAFVSSVGTYMFMTSRQSEEETTISQPIVIPPVQTVAQPTLAPVNSTLNQVQKPLSTVEKFAFQVNGDAYLSDTNLGNNQKLTNSGKIDVLYNFSPDNKYILALTSTYGNNSWEHVVIDTQTATEIKIPIVQTGEGVSNFVWINNKEIIYINENILHRVTVNGQQEQIGIVPSGIQSDYRLNKTANRIIYDTSRGEFTGDVFIYDFIKKQKKQLTQVGGAYAIDWVNDFILYKDNKSIWRTTKEGNREKLMEAGVFIEGEAISDRANRILYYFTNSSRQSQLFLFDRQSSVTKELALLSLDKYPYMNIVRLSISPSGLFGTYDLYDPKGNTNPPTILVDFNTNKMVNICEALAVSNSCAYVVWSNFE
ncbi:MAG TPA: hypothetical protein VJH96_00215 [Patescibacteria group bacterium]|nr:hypothetical protein [Patescibacteria group bacterium]